MADERSPQGFQDDWAANLLSYLPIWGLPKVAIIISAFAATPLRTVVWIAALACMGVACIMNSRRCGRVHCRYTGPFYLILIVPVGLLGAGGFELGHYAWIALGALGVFGGYAITWVTESAWGRYENSRRQP
ncbi:MAG: hypothetical protein ACR2PZ_26385 [Pseudomonadales bacterium]